MKKLFLQLGLLMLTGLTGAAIAVAQDDAAPRELGADDPVARVNGEQIYLADLLTAQTLLPGDVREQPFEALFPQLLQLVIEQRLFSAAANEAGVPTNADFQREVRFIVDRLLQDRYIDLLLGDTITQELFNAEVESLREQLGTTEQARARHILLSDKSNVALADDLIARIKAGDDFGELAKEYSQDPGSGARGGDLGTFGRGRMVPEFEAAVFSQTPGEVSDPAVETQFGLHIIIVDERFDVEPDPQQLASRALQQLQGRIVGEKAEELREAASVQLIDENGDLPPAE